MSNKVKNYRSNPVSKSPPANVATTSYVPQYKQLGIVPIGQNQQVVPSRQAQSDNARVNRNVPQSTNRQPYAEPVPSPIGRGGNLMPNVGNNAEQTWSGVDGIVDDISGIDPNEPMIDNNEYVSDVALGLSSGEVFIRANGSSQQQVNIPAQQVQRPIMAAQPAQELPNDQFLPSILQQLDEDDYLLLVNGECSCSGPSEYVQEQARLLVFGEHESCNGEPIPVSNIVVLKRVAIKVGLFLS